MLTIQLTDEDVIRLRMIDVGQPRAGPHYPFRGLLSVHSRYGLHARRVAWRDLLHRRLQPLRRLHDCSDCYRLEESCQRNSHPLRNHAFSRRTEVCGLVRRVAF